MALQLAHLVILAQSKASMEAAAATTTAVQDNTAAVAADQLMDMVQEVAQEAKVIQVVRTIIHGLVAVAADRPNRVKISKADLVPAVRSQVLV
jgi:hypothetical protein